MLTLKLFLALNWYFLHCVAKSCIVISPVINIMYWLVMLMQQNTIQGADISGIAVIYIAASVQTYTHACSHVHIPMHGCMQVYARRCTHMYTFKTNLFKQFLLHLKLHISDLHFFNCSSSLRLPQLRLHHNYILFYLVFFCSYSFWLFRTPKQVW